MPASSAIAQLDDAFAAKASRVRRGAHGPCIGLFGGFPQVLAAASGVDTVDVADEPVADAGVHCVAIEGFIEPFVDHSARRFLHRLFSGAFDDLAAIVFARGTAAAHIAYLYANEFRRQGLARARPTLLLWNFLHTTSDAAAAFNLKQAGLIEAALVAAGGARWTDGALTAAITAERGRQEALDGLEALRSDGKVSGAEAMRWRNAGRYMTASTHAGLLKEAAREVASRPHLGGLRLGLLGSPTTQAWLYALLEEFGTVVTDPQPFGTAWPARLQENATLDALLAATAADPLAPQSLAVERQNAAFVDACVNANCDLVAFQLDEHDDVFGWQLPDIRGTLESAGIATADIGFAPQEVGAEWRSAARATMSAAVDGLGERGR